jgi:hypothetical protein
MAAIHGYPPNTKFRTLAMDHYKVAMCGSHEGCEQGIGKLGHKLGRVDRKGNLHWDRADMRASKRGLRHLYKLLALSQYRPYQRMPKWKRLWLTNVWATKEVKRTLHHRIRKDWSRHDAQLIAGLLEKSRTRPDNILEDEPGLMQWLHNRGYTVPRRKVKKPR